MELKDIKVIADKLSIAYPAEISSTALSNIVEENCQKVDCTLEDITSGTITVDAVKKKLDVYRSKESKRSPTSAQENSEEVERLRNLTFAKAAGMQKEKDDITVMKDAMKLIRCQISCNNKNKTSLTGEIFSARNAIIPEVKKFIQYNVPTHVPQILLNVIREKKLQLFKEEKNIRGDRVKVPYLVDEYNIQELPPLTAEEFNSIRQKQLAEGR